MEKNTSGTLLSLIQAVREYAPLPCAMGSTVLVARTLDLDPLTWWNVTVKTMTPVGFSGSQAELMEPVKEMKFEGGLRMTEQHLDTRRRVCNTRTSKN